MQHVTPDKPRKRRWKKILIIFFSIVFVLIVLVIAFISPITKYLIEKYDEKYIGRRITLDWAYVNPFTGYVYVKNLKVYEPKGDSVFFSSDGIAANFSVGKMISGTYEISSLTLTRPKSTIIQADSSFNFDDILEKLTDADTLKKDDEPTRFSVLNVRIKNGTFRYREKSIPIDYFIKNVNVRSTGLRWNADTVATSYSLRAGIGTGKINGHITANIKKREYRMWAVVRKFSAHLLEQYMKDLSNYGKLRGTVDANFQSSGSFDDESESTATGLLAINNFHIGKNKNEDYAAFEKLVVSIKEISPNKHIYDYDSVSVLEPYFKYEKYDSLDNLQTMFGEGGSKIAAANANPAKFNLIIEIADYVKEIAKNFFKSDYNVGRLAVYKADFRFNDFSTSEKFAIGLNPLTLIADSIDRKREKVTLICNSGMMPYGHISTRLILRPRDSVNFDLHYRMENVPLAMFNPYTITYTSFPLDRGTMQFNGVSKVNNGIINSYNHLVIIDPRSSKRVRNKDNKWIPMPLILAVTRDRGNVIDYEIPISGNLKDPKFHWLDPVVDLFRNLVVKPPTTPYRMEVKSVERKIEKALTLKWGMKQYEASGQQEKALEKMATFLKTHNDASIVVYPQQYAEKEKEHILFYLAKKQYYQSVHGSNFTASDSERVEKMSVKEPPFLNYIDKKVNNALVFTSQEKCAIIIGQNKVDAAFAQLCEKRKQIFLEVFKDEGVADRVKIMGNQHVVPYNGFSFYKITYKGELPDWLTEAWEKIDDINDGPPRNKYRRNKKKKGTIAT